MKSGLLALTLAIGCEVAAAPQYRCLNIKRSPDIPKGAAPDEADTILDAFRAFTNNFFSIVRKSRRKESVVPELAHIAYLLMQTGMDITRSPSLQNYHNLIVRCRSALKSNRKNAA